MTGVSRDVRIDMALGYASHNKRTKLSPALRKAYDKHDLEAARETLRILRGMTAAVEQAVGFMETVDEPPAEHYVNPRSPFGI